MNLTRQKILILISALILLGLGYSMYRFGGQHYSENYGEPLYNLMVYVSGAVLVAFLIRNGIYKIWKYILYGSFLLAVVSLVNTPVECNAFLPIFCSKADNAQLFGFLFLIVTSVFVVVSLVISMVLYIKHRSQKEY